MNKKDRYQRLIDKDSSEPIYYQIYRIIRQEIENEEFEMNDFLPSENAYRMYFEVSKVTIRKSMELLERDGYIHREKGRGARVLDYKDTFYWSKLTSFTTYLKTQKITSIVLEFGIEKASAKVSKLLGLKINSKVYKLVRIRLINNKRIALATCYLSFDIPIKLTREMFDENTSLFSLLENAGLKIGNCDETIEAQIPTQKIKELLQMDKNTAIFYRERVTYDQEGNPFEYVTIEYNADYYKYFIKSRVAEREQLLSKGDKNEF